jgi:prepilin-type N-terminal cleavage/methylation domain-containing protein
MKKNRLGFTLVEVMVALGIAGGALVLLLSANRESLRRSVGSRAQALLEQLAQSKLDELKQDLEKRRSGEFPGLAGYTWDAAEESGAIEGVKELHRIALRVRDPNRRIIRSMETLVYRPKAERDR